MLSKHERQSNKPQQLIQPDVSMEAESRLDSPPFPRLTSVTSAADCLHSFAMSIKSTVHDVDLFFLLNSN
jgi:hypothetical protein